MILIIQPTIYYIYNIYTYYIYILYYIIYTWWLIPHSKWVITPVIHGISRVNPLITGVITHLLSGMSHQVVYIYIHIYIHTYIYTIYIICPTMSPLYPHSPLHAWLARHGGAFSFCRRPEVNLGELELVGALEHGFPYN